MAKEDMAKFQTHTSFETVGLIGMMAPGRPPEIWTCMEAPPAN